MQTGISESDAGICQHWGLDGVRLGTFTPKHPHGARRNLSNELSKEHHKASILHVDTVYFRINGIAVAAVAVHKMLDVVENITRVLAPSRILVVWVLRGRTWF